MMRSAGCTPTNLGLAMPQHMYAHLPCPLTSGHSAGPKLLAMNNLFCRLRFCAICLIYGFSLLLLQACLSFANRCISTETVCPLLKSADRYIHYKSTKPIVKKVSSVFVSLLLSAQVHIDKAVHPFLSPLFCMSI